MTFNGSEIVCVCRFMEQSNMLMEQRNDSLKNSSEQNQARILQAEQEKVKSQAHCTLNSLTLYTHSIHTLFCSLIREAKITGSDTVI